MMKYKVVLMAFPFDDFSGSKIRPAVCLTDPIGPHRHVVFAFITSRVSGVPLASDLVLAAEAPDFSYTGLRVSSTLQLHRLLTATPNLVRRELGLLPPRVQAELQSRLRALFGV